MRSEVISKRQTFMQNFVNLYYQLHLQRQMKLICSPPRCNAMTMSPAYASTFLWEVRLICNSCPFIIGYQISLTVSHKDIVHIWIKYISQNWVLNHAIKRIEFVNVWSTAFVLAPSKTALLLAATMDSHYWWSTGSVFFCVIQGSSAKYIAIKSYFLYSNNLMCEKRATLIDFVTL